MTSSLPTLNQFWKILRNHDWTFEYSDDHSVWRKGSAELSIISSIVKEGGVEYKKLFDEYSSFAWRKDNSIKEPTRPQPTHIQQKQDLEAINNIINKLELIKDDIWNLESDQIIDSVQLWKILNPAESIMHKIRNIVEDKNNSVMKDTVAFKGYRRLKEALDTV